MLTIPIDCLKLSFRALATGECGVSVQSQVPLSYKGSIIHRSIPGFMIQGGGAISQLCLIAFINQCYA